MDMQVCINNCKNCQQVCLETLDYCREKGGEHADGKHLKLLEDCAKICEINADFMERESDNHQKTCSVCADICNQCAEACEQFEDDEQMQKCVQICRKCAESCGQMSN